MSTTISYSPLAVVLGTVFTVSLANTTISNAAENPFSMVPLSGANIMLAEGKCGMSRMDADGDGKVTKDEFMKGHEVKFEEIDQNSDGVIDPAERGAHMQKMRGFMKEGKCGEGKCGGSK